MHTVLLSLCGICIAVTMLIIFSLKGAETLFLYPVACVVVLLFSGFNVVEGVFTDYAARFGEQAASFCFTLSCPTMFAYTMVENRSAQCIADHLGKIVNPKYGPAFILVISGFLSSIGLGVGTWAIMYPIALTVFSKGDYSEDLLFAVIYASTTSWGNGFPGSPTTLNAIAAKMLNVGTFEGLIPGMLATFVTIAGQVVFILWLGNKWKRAGRTFTRWEDIQKSGDERAHARSPHLAAAVLPIVAIPVMFNVLRFSLPLSMVIGTILSSLLTSKQRGAAAWFKTWQDGFMGGVRPMLQNCAKGAFGILILSTPAYDYALISLTRLNIHPYFVLLIAAILLSAITGSTNASVTAVLTQVDYILNAFAGEVVSRGNIMRIVVNGASCFDKLPHNAMNGYAMDILHTDYKRSYWTGFINGCIIPLIGGGICTIASFWY